MHTATRSTVVRSAPAYRLEEVLSAHARVGYTIAEADPADHRWTTIEPLVQAVMSEAQCVISLVEADTPNPLSRRAAELVDEPLAPVARLRALAFLELRLRAALRSWDAGSAPDWAVQTLADSAARLHRIADDVEAVVAAHEDL